MQHTITQHFQQSKLVQLARRRWLSLLVLLSAGTVTLFVIGQTITPPAINLSSDPLFAASSADKPTMALALSVEFPTVGAQYLPNPAGSSDSSYSNANEYLGYYDAESCYTYNDAPTETIASGLTPADYKRFDRSGPAIVLTVPNTAQPSQTSRMCTNAFSGNFLNWASNSAIDMLRLALSGGDRYIDTASLTILQRAIVPNGNPSCFWNTGNFPAKQLQKNGAGTGKYWGAVPAAMITQAAGSDIWVANTLNQIYFRAGSSSAGSCTDQSGYTLGTPPAPANWMGTTTSYSAQPTGANAWPTSPVYSRGTTIVLTGVQEVLYGRTSSWISAPASGTILCSNATFGGGTNNSGNNCYVRNNTTTQNPPAVAASLTSDAFFYARVQACNTNISGVLQDARDYGLCTQYPNGYYKPTGSIQKYSDQLRLAAFGYLMDQTQSSAGGRYGGVLRAPMKFVGLKTFNEVGTDNTPTGGNPKAEWDAGTGVFRSNPDGDTSTTPNISGVINYLNKFGRTGPTAGLYKKYDPVGELYGEALRYLQGLGPTSSAISGLTTAMYDGFPVYTSWSDPYGGTRTAANDYSCLKANIVVIGDVNTHDSSTLLTRTADTTNNIQDFSAWKSVVTKFEANTSGTYLDGQNTSRNIANPNTANTQAQSVSSGSQVLTGQAYWAHTHDIRGTGWTAGSGPSLQRPGLRVKSYFFDVNENGSSYTASYRQNQNQFFTSAKYGGFQSDPSNIGGNPYNAYGNPFKRQDGTNDNNVWQDFSAAGEASTFYLSSTKARNTLSAFDSIFGRAATAARSIAGSAAASKNITQAGSTIYQGAFDTNDWSGDVFAVPLIVSSANVVSVGVTNIWSAATRLNNLATPATSRNIVVGRPGASANPTATAFIWAAIDTALKNNLAKTTPLATTDTLAQDRLDYIKGDSSKEGNPFRPRNKLLGDIVNSGVVYSGTPTTNLGSSNGYTAFYTANASRTPAVFVGANDGMMHAFNATTGDEMFGYIPSWMGPKLAALTTASYNSNHQSYVDASPVVSEAKVGLSETDSGAAWKTVLVSGTGGGGPGVFALDVTTPSTFTAANVMWEFTRADDPDLGNVVGRPQIVKLRTSAWNAAATYRWFAVVASGINNYVTDTTGSFTAAPINTTGGNPALFLLALDKPTGTAWTATGSTPNYYKITLPVDSTLSATTAPGLINFRVAFGASGDATQVYMGDLHGKLWKLDFTLNNPLDTLGNSNWTMYKLSPFKKTVAGVNVAYPLYIAQTASSAIQPISMAPSVVAGPIVGGFATSYIAFATGKYLEVLDKTSTTQNTIYSVYDNGTSTADTSPAGNAVISGRGRLQAGTSSIPSAGTITVPAFTWGRAASNTDASQRSGWYVDFASSGERGISSASVFGDNLVFGSLIPGAGVAGSCAAAGGGGYQYSINIDNGNGTFTTSTVGILGEPLLAEIVSAVRYTVSTSTGRRIKTVVKQVIQQGSLGVGSSTTGSLTTTFVTGRLSWRQINNYQDLKNN